MFMKKKLSLAHEVFVICMTHEEALRYGSRAEMAVAEVCVDELVALGQRELAKL